VHGGIAGRSRFRADQSQPMPLGPPRFPDRAFAKPERRRAATQAVVRY